MGVYRGVPEGLISEKLTGWVLPYDDWSAALQAEYSYNPGKARELLAEAGYPDGFKTKITAANSQEDIELLESIKSQFMEIGVDMEIEMMDFVTKKSISDAGSYDQMLYSNHSGLTRIPIDVFPYYVSTSPQKQFLC